ncbi:MAG: nucleotidyltransferase domain-containing protein [Polyangiales bacterium]
MAPPNAAPEDAAALKVALRDELAALRDEGARGLGGVAHARRVAAVYDRALGALWSRVTSRKTRGRVSLLAVGGYGRGTLGVGSDVDLVLLHDGRDPRAAHALAESLLYPLWDASVAVGHAVHSADDFVALAREDLRTG